FQGEETFLTFVGVFVLGLLVVNNTGKALSTWLMLRYQNRLAHTLARRLLASYMVRPYSFFLGSNTAELGSRILMEANRVISGVLSPLTDVISNSLACLAIL